MTFKLKSCNSKPVQRFRWAMSPCNLN